MIETKKMIKDGIIYGETTPKPSHYGISYYRYDDSSLFQTFDADMWQCHFFGPILLSQILKIVFGLDHSLVCDCSSYFFLGR